jgi:hypothetical protein
MATAQRSTAGAKSDVVVEVCQSCQGRTIAQRLRTLLAVALDAGGHGSNVKVRECLSRCPRRGVAVRMDRGTHVGEHAFMVEVNRLDARDAGVESVVAFATQANTHNS